MTFTGFSRVFTQHCTPSLSFQSGKHCILSLPSMWTSFKHGHLTAIRGGKCHPYYRHPLPSLPHSLTVRAIRYPKNLTFCSPCGGVNWREGRWQQRNEDESVGVTKYSTCFFNQIYASDSAADGGGGGNGNEEGMRHRETDGRQLARRPKPRKNVASKGHEGDNVSILRA